MINWKGDNESLTIPQMVCRLNKAEQSIYSRPALTEGERIVNYIKQVRGLEKANRRLKKPILVCSVNKSIINENAELKKQLEDELTFAHDDLSALRRENVELRGTIKDDQQVNDILNAQKDKRLTDLISRNNALSKRLKSELQAKLTIWQRIKLFWKA